MPFNAAPTAIPAIEDSANGVSITLSSPYFSKSPSVARKTPPRTPTSSPRMNTESSLAISSEIASFIASIRFFSVMRSLLSNSLNRRDY